MKQKSIRKKILFAIVALSIVLILCTCITVGKFYKEKQLGEYGEQAIAYAKIAASYIDGDRVTKYAETKQKDEYYRQVQEFLNIAQKESNIKYYYVFVPYEENLVYIWDADNEDGACELGAYEEYWDDGIQIVSEVFCKNPKEYMTFHKDEEYGYIASAFYPVFDSKGEPVALAGVDLSMPKIRKEMMQFQLTIMFTIVTVILLFQTFLYIYMKRSFVLPINKLSIATKELVGHLEQGENIEIDISTQDEIEELAKSFIHMNEEVQQYIKKLEKVTSEKERISTELNVATQIQADMLPRIFPAFPERKEFDIYASMCPAKEVGGDFYDFFLTDENHLAMVIADVSGKGVPAALFMVIAKTLIKNRAQMGGTPAEIIKDVNAQLCEGNEAGMFITVWLAIIELSTGRTVTVNAGHEYPAIMRKDGKFELIKRKHSPAVAVLEDIDFAEYEFKLEPGDKLFVYTDGIPEACNENNEMYSLEAMVNALNIVNQDKTEKIIKTMNDYIQAYMGAAEQFDDITMVCFEYVGI